MSKPFDALFGVQRALHFVTSEFHSSSDCRQYREDHEWARAEVHFAVLLIEKHRVCPEDCCLSGRPALPNVT